MKVEPVLACLGENRNYETILGLSDKERATPNFIDTHDNTQILANSFESHQGEALPLRIKFILSQALSGADIPWKSAPVILLLPQPESHQTIYNHDDLYRELFSQLCEVIVDLKTHSQCFLFPYGRSALILAWNKIIALLREHGSIWVLAVDSDPRFRGLDSPGGSSNALIANESVLLTKLYRSETGLNCQWHSVEAQTRDKQPSVAVESLFHRFKRQSGETVRQLYVPYTDHESGAAEWANVYSSLHPHVDANTQVVMSGATVGELGACSGLYNLFRIYESYQREIHDGFTLQLESSEQLYRAVALYSWHQ
ncbi:hypothetical protein [Photobacterium atrarenae]|uniref:Uncharacterized protein n=1 Tax=Photobacterium atrarenae TaxID=865757 RepID=A0ABY5GCQ1_9GAMM|nr:hypothetical protein [Photobacterium atrarenae]UTV26484.1 hypothetical protein NNL38_08845 [Photobacterium atrarenae]